MRFATLTALGGVLLLPVMAQAAVTVSFTDPDHFTDAGQRADTARARAKTRTDVEKFLQSLGAEYLPAGRILTIEILDIDLAGRFEPWNLAAHDVRFMTDVTWPRFRLRYTLTDGEHVVLQAEETIRDQNYQMNPAGRISTDPLVYEKTMLREWFKDRFVDGKPPRGA